MAFARLSLAEQAVRAVVDVYNIHAPFIPDSEGTPDLVLIADALKVIEAAVPPAPGSRVIPPVLTGDFNNTRDNMDNEVLPGNNLEQLEIFAYSPPPPNTDVIGTMLGKPNLFPSVFLAKLGDNRFLPETPPPLCGNLPVRWSDHCGQYVEILLTPR